MSKLNLHKFVSEFDRSL